MYQLDNRAIGFIEKLDANGFMEYTERTNATICGKYPIAVLLELSKLLGAKRARKLHYYTSADKTDDYSAAVGYASIAIGK